MTRAFVRLHDAVHRRQGLVLAALAVLVGVGAFGATRLQTDVSFQPFFADDADARLTERFEDRFGQRSGEYVVAILESDDVLAPSFLGELQRLDDEVADLPHVVETISLPTARTVAPGPDGRPQVVPLVPPSTLHGGTGGLDPEAREALLARPEVRGQLVARDGRSTALLARVDLPLADLDGRGQVIDRFEEVVAAHAPPGSSPRITGVSVVERAYGSLVLRSLATSVLVASTLMLVILWVRYRRVAAVVAVMSGVWAAMPMTLGALWLLGLDLTAINSTVLTIVLVIGVTHGIHLQEEFYRQRELGHPADEAGRRMFARLAVPLAATSLTTFLGFASLRTAGIEAIRDFALASSIGILVVYCTQNLLVPIVQARFQTGAAHDRMAGRARLTTAILRFVDRTTTRRPAAVLAVGAVAFLAFTAWGIPRLVVDQRFNEEVAASQPVRADQKLLEEQYTGFLGPELWVRPTGGEPMTSPRMLERLRTFTAELRDLPEVIHVESVTDLLPPGLSGPEADAWLDGLRADDAARHRVAGLVADDGSDAAVVVRTTDMGTARARPFADDIEALAADAFGDDARVDVVGQWWRAQQGMTGLLSDTLRSAATALLTILPVMFLVLRSWRLIVASILPSIVPVVASLAVMGALDIPLRVGTAMILAIALGLVDDDTILFLHRLRQEERDGSSPRHAVREMLLRTAPAGLFSSLVLVAGFVALSFNEFHAIRDMAIVAAATMLIAVVADLVLDPAQFLLLNGRAGRGRRRGGGDGHGDAGEPADPQERTAAAAGVPTPARPEAIGTPT